MITIEIDDEVFNKLQSLAKPLIDTPNSVLRRVLDLKQRSLDNETKSHLPSISTMSSTQGTPTAAFMSFYMKSRFNEKFRTRTPYRTMFESDNNIIYFHNYNNKGAKNLWYRISVNSLRDLRSSRKKSIICFTNPAERFAYEIPLVDIDQRARKVMWKRDYYEVNIDPANARWREMDWRLDKYYVEISM